MKNLFLVYFSIVAFCVKAQQPFVGTPTVIPQNPSSTSIIKVVTKVITANQSIVVDMPSHTVTAQQIKIRACYSQGLLPATQSYIDTLVIGQLATGNYQILQKAYLSSTQQHCTPIDSNQVVLQINVGTGVSTGIAPSANHQALMVEVFPNPAFNTLNIQGLSEEAEVLIFSASGSFLKNEKHGLPTIDISDLPQGLYFIRVSDKNASLTKKFIKSEADN